MAAQPGHQTREHRHDHLGLPLGDDIIPTICMCGGPPQCALQGAFFQVLQSCGMNFLVRCFRDDTTWVPSKKACTPSLKAGNAPVIPLELQEIVGGGDHLTTGDSYACLSSYSIKKTGGRRQDAAHHVGGLRPHIEYCCHLCSSNCRGPVLCKRLDHLALRRDVATLLFRRTAHLIPAAEFHLRTTCHKLGYHPHHQDVWRSPQCVQRAFFHVLHRCGMNFLERCFRDDTTQPYLTTWASNAPVNPLVLQENVGGGDHLTPVDQYARLSFFSIKRKKS
ncbi:unnamed protein product [Leptidea sinapis]|uniref:Uncharacterized protein n=1 Tax=Leptidea sinapis TaxID=189913 RepID=A0A5E4QM91_9NEOP|nr:unnamed protein product [Leptidea sinapis]